MGMKPGLHHGYKTQTELSESRVLRRWFECDRKEMTGESIKLYNELYDLFATKYPFFVMQHPNLGLGHFNFRLLDHIQFRPL
jgi:hypothetical protein